MIKAALVVRLPRIVRLSMLFLGPISKMVFPISEISRLEDDVVFFCWLLSLTSGGCWLEVNPTSY